MGKVYTTTAFVKPVDVASAQPLDVRTVLQSETDLEDRTLMKLSYVGMVVCVVGNESTPPSLYMCIHKPSGNYNNPNIIINKDECWKKVDVDYSVRIVESESNITDGTFKFFYKGMMVYAANEGSLYIRMVKGMSNDPSDFNTNWKKITVASTSASTPTVDKVAIDDVPEGGSGFKISGNKGVIIDDYVNAENYIKAKYTYTSKGVNSFEPNPYFNESYVILSKEGVEDGYIELYVDGENWINIHNPNSLGLSVTVNGENYVSDTPISKETPVCFGVDIKFHEGWIITYGNGTQNFTINDYDLIDIYRSEYSPEVYAYYKDIDVRMLTEDDLVSIDDKIDSLAHSIMVDIGDSDGSDSDATGPVTLQEAIANINSSITKLEQTKPEPETINDSDILDLFS